MPELPEVETVRAYLERVRGGTLSEVILRRADLRYPIDVPAMQQLAGATITAVRRRAKYLLLDVHGARGAAVLLVHLGMSGRLFVDDLVDAPWEKHEHARFVLDGAAEHRLLRFVDPRRFGALDTFKPQDEGGHKLLRHLGPEPLGDAFDGRYLHSRCKGRKVAIKQLIMDAKVVVGVGNIYASESLWRAGVSPKRAAGRLSRKSCNRLATAIVDVLQEAIAAGGTTLRDFVGCDSSPGYFQQRLDVYDCAGQPCHRKDDGVIRNAIQQARMTYWCPKCQR